MTKSRKPPIDISAVGDMSFLRIMPTSEAGETWLLENVGESTAGLGQWPTYLCEHRYGPDLLLGAHNAGLTVALNGRIADAPRA